MMIVMKWMILTAKICDEMDDLDSKYSEEKDENQPYASSDIRLRDCVKIIQGDFVEYYACVEEMHPITCFIFNISNPSLEDMLLMKMTLTSETRMIYVLLLRKLTDVPGLPFLKFITLFLRFTNHLECLFAVL